MPYRFTFDQNSAVRPRRSSSVSFFAEQQRTAFGNIDSLADAIGAPGDRSITQRLDTIERVLFALAGAQGIDPDTTP